ncbi:MAG: alkaline phosphatase family protein, partial [Planctomycetota bacterium]
MSLRHQRSFTRRQFLIGSAAAAAAAGGGVAWHVLTQRRRAASHTKRVIVLAFDGMDPGLCERLMAQGKLKNFTRLANAQGFRRLGTSIPPQSPVAWANFINGADPGSHGIFDFIQRDPADQCANLYYSGSRTTVGDKGWTVGDHRLHLDFWPFNQKPPETLLLREGKPFWDDLDAAGIDSTFYNLPSNYPPSKSKHGYHRCLSGLGTPDLLGGYGNYQYFHNDINFDPEKDLGGEQGGHSTFFFFENGTSHQPLKLRGPDNTSLIKPQPTGIEFKVYRDSASGTVGIELQGRRIMLTEGQWTEWLKVRFEQSMPSFLPDRNVSGICRFFLRSLDPFRLYCSPINIDPSDPATQISEPNSFITDMSREMGLFYTTGFQEDYHALRNGVFTDANYAEQSQIVLDERLALMEYSFKHYDDGVLFFYFSSTDLQSHMFWWEGDGPHPVRSPEGAREYMHHMAELYERADGIIGDVLDRYGDSATVMVMSDHGFCNFKRQFDINAWLRDEGYLQTGGSRSLTGGIDWAGTKAYALGINSLYLNLWGRERDGSVDPRTKDALLDELAAKLEAVEDVDGQRIIRRARRTDRAYHGPATALAPDLVVGYKRGYRAAWDTPLGYIGDDVFSDNTVAWSADHCSDPLEVPGVLLSNRPLAVDDPFLWDLAPSILTEFGLPIG